MRYILYIALLPKRHNKLWPRDDLKIYAYSGYCDVNMLRLKSRS